MTKEIYEERCIYFRRGKKGRKKGERERERGNELCKGFAISSVVYCVIYARVFARKKKTNGGAISDSRWEIRRERFFHVRADE